MAAKLILVIPAYNEADIIASAVLSVRAALEAIPDLAWRIVVVDNGSCDGTAKVVNDLALPNASALTTPERGKGAAILRGAREARADEYFGFIDADLSVDPRHIADVLNALAAGADVAVGSRLVDTRIVKRSWPRTLSSEAFNQLRQLLVYAPVKDSQCGLKLMNERGRAELLKCKERGWFLDMEFLARAYKAGLSIREVAVSWNEHHFPSRKSKLNLARDGVNAVVAMFRIHRTLK